MALEVLTIPAEITDDMNDYLQISIKSSNKIIEQKAELYKNSPINKLDPNDGRKVIITLRVDPNTGSIEEKRDFRLS